MRKVTWMFGVLGIVASVGTVSAQSARPVIASPAARLAVLTTAGGEVQCKTCAMVDHVEHGMIHMFDLGGSHADNFVQSEIPQAKEAMVRFASARRNRSVVDDFGGRACGGTSDCHEEWRVGDCHVACSGGSEVKIAERMEGAARLLDMETLRHELLQCNGRVRLNVARSAVQIIGCNDTVAYHMPLSTIVVAQLNTWLQSATRAE